MQVLALFRAPQVVAPSKMCGKKKIVSFNDFLDSLPFSPLIHGRTFTPVHCKEVAESIVKSRKLVTNAMNVGTGSDGYEERYENDKHGFSIEGIHNDKSSKIETSPLRSPYLLSIALVLSVCTLLYFFIAFMKGPSVLLPLLTKSGFTAAFSLIFVSEIADKTFFIAALLAMQHEQLMVLLGSMGALSFKTVVSVMIGWIFKSVPSQFRTTLPIGEFAAVTLLMFFGIQSIKDAWKLPNKVAKPNDERHHNSDELDGDADEEVPHRLTREEVFWESFGLVFFAEWGDRSMLATIALGATQSPWGVASGAIAGHLLATFIAVLGGSFLAHYVSEKLAGFICGALFLVFAVAAFFRVF